MDASRQPTTITAHGLTKDSLAYLSATQCLGVSIQMVLVVRRLSRVLVRSCRHKKCISTCNILNHLIPVKMGEGHTLFVEKTNCSLRQGWEYRRFLIYVLLSLHRNGLSDISLCVPTGTWSYMRSLGPKYVFRLIFATNEVPYHRFTKEWLKVNVS